MWMTWGLSFVVILYQKKEIWPLPKHEKLAIRND